MKSEDIKKLLEHFQKITYQILIEHDTNAIFYTLKIYFEVLCKASGYLESDSYIESFMQLDCILFDISEQELLEWKTDLAIKLASLGKKLYLILPWIINYFSRSKSATIDLNRHKLESFLLVSTQPEINDAIKAALHNENCYIREHMADIVGEKVLEKAAPVLFAQLKIEENFFTAASIISAIGKIRNSDGIFEINNWIDHNWKEINSTKQFFVLRRAMMAISNLDNTADSMHINRFTSKYGEILKNYYII